MSAAPASLERLAAATVAAAVAAALVWLGPAGTDLAAHAYQRALYVQHGFVLWNNFWYAGRYSFVTYSVLYYPLAAAVGIKLLAVLVVACGVAAFAAVVHRVWGDESRWAIRVFALAWAALVVSAAYPFMLGCALALVAVSLLQRGRVWGFTLAAAASLAASPLAFGLLVVVLAGVAAAHRRAAAAPFVAVAAICCGELVLQRMFPARGRFPFSPEEFAAATAFCVIGIGMTWRVPRANILRWTFAAYLVACSAAFAIPSPIGENVARLRFVAAPLAVLTLSLRQWRPRAACVVVLALALSWNLTPLAASVAHSTDDPAAKAAYWTPATRFLHAHLPPGLRVEAVDTANHWPAYFLARARIPLARGWFRQEDFPLNKVLYGEMRAAAYVRWLRALSVKYVVLTTATPDYSARDEARLLATGSTRLRTVFADAHLRIFSVPAPRPLVSAPARVLGLGYTTIRIVVPRRGTYRVGVTYTPYWRAKGACLERSANGMTRLVARRAGIAVLRFAVTPVRALETIAGDTDGCATSALSR